jgi:hypothetical protein
LKSGGFGTKRAPKKEICETNPASSRCRNEVTVIDQRVSLISAREPTLGDSMNQETGPEKDLDMLPEYDFAQRVRGAHHEAYKAGNHVVLLDSDLAETRNERNHHVEGTEGEA